MILFACLAQGGDDELKRCKLPDIYDGYVEKKGEELPKYCSLS